MNPEPDLSQPPAAQGFAMPPEWAPHAATWLAWPHKEASWPGKLERIPPIFAAMACALIPGEHVHINVRDAAMGEAARAVLAAAGADLEAITLHEIPFDDSWIRDHGPIFLNHASGEQAIVDWEYNAWGGKYRPYDRDNVVPEAIAAGLNLPVWRPGLVLEGGSIDVDGAGNLLTTESCLLNPNRNPGHTREEIEAALRDYLGVRRILWLGDGIAGDDTDGHVDDLTRFVAPGVVVTAVEERRSDENFEPLRANLARLRALTGADGRGLEIHTLPMPDPVVCEGQRLPASYANFYIGNRAVLLPQFGCPQDAAAHQRLAALFPGRDVVDIDCRDLIWGLGAFHCLTQQQPKPSRRDSTPADATPRPRPASQ